MKQRPLCFVLLPLGRKSAWKGTTIDFDFVYRELVEPAVEAAELEPIRADKDIAGVETHKPMFERMLLCDYAVVDLTTTTGNVLYELGTRDAIKPNSTITLFPADEGPLPFDTWAHRAIRYHLDESSKLSQLDGDRKALTDQLREARHCTMPSPLHKLVGAYSGVVHQKTDVFRQWVAYDPNTKNRLAAARRAGNRKGIIDVARALQDFNDLESGVIIDLLLSYRAVKSWSDMVTLVRNMPKPLRQTAMVQEQLGLALNRIGRGAEAEHVLEDVLDLRGPSSETYGILGRVFKDRWEKARRNGSSTQVGGLLQQAIDAYRKGFEADFRDAYPGVNALTLMELKQPPDAAREKLMPVVEFAVEQKMSKGEPDYWDQATVLELAVLNKNERAAAAALEQALSMVREVWEPETTARNLRLIREAREHRGEQPDWANDAENSLIAWREHRPSATDQTRETH